MNEQQLKSIKEVVSIADGLQQRIDKFQRARDRLVEATEVAATLRFAEDEISVISTRAEDTEAYKQLQTLLPNGWETVVVNALADLIDREIQRAETTYRELSV